MNKTIRELKNEKNEYIDKQLELEAEIELLEMDLIAVTDDIEDLPEDVKERIGNIDDEIEDIQEKLEDAKDSLSLCKQEINDAEEEIDELRIQMHSVYERVVDEINQIISPLGLYAKDTTNDYYATSHYVDVYMQDNDNIRDDYLLAIRLSDHDQPVGGGYSYEKQETFGDSDINIIVHPNQYDTFKVNEEELLQKIKQEIEESEVL